MNITDEMVDAYLISMPVGWSGHLDEVRAGLAGVAPLMAAQALRDMADSLDRTAGRWSDGTATDDERHVAHGVRTSAAILRRMAQIEVAVEDESAP